MSELEHQQLGAYAVHEELGRGGMAVVYRATHPEYGAVALKVLPAYFVHDPDALKRFVREAQAITALSHRHIINVYETGDAPDPTTGSGHIHFLAMEYLAGGSLADQLSTGQPLSVEQAVTLGAQIGSALDYAHTHKIIHRDIKPSNILFRANGEAVLTDFGIAHAGDSSRLTRTGSVAGTIAYMAPESAQGLGASVRSDIYSLGLVLYEALTTTNPYIDHDSHIVATMHRVVSEPLPPIQFRNKAVSPALGAVIHRACAKKPDERPASMSAFVTDLQQAHTRGSFSVPVASISSTPNLRKIALTPAQPTPIVARAAPAKRRLQLPALIKRQWLQWGGLGLGVAVVLWVLLQVLVSDPASGETNARIAASATPARLLNPTSQATPPAALPALGATATLPPESTATATALPDTAAPAVQQAEIVPTAAPVRVNPTSPPAPAAAPTNPPPADRDGDGVPDSSDACPDTGGPNNGCPAPTAAPQIADADGDGVPDDQDFCPSVAQGSQGRGGCPDSDGDGIVDKDDQCPNEPGVAHRGGCPNTDTDGDGLPDHLDACPNDAGSINGCPDSDGDGRADIQDGCPYEPGSASNGGCPAAPPPPAPRPGGARPHIAHRSAKHTLSSNKECHERA